MRHLILTPTNNMPDSQNGVSMLNIVWVQKDGASYEVPTYMSWS